MREEGLCKEECAKKLWEQEGEEKEELLTREVLLLLPPLMMITESFAPNPKLC
jgi:hypothetical protein